MAMKLSWAILFLKAAPDSFVKFLNAWYPLIFRYFIIISYLSC